jgi:hypothetical protein
MKTQNKLQISIIIFVLLLGFIGSAFGQEPVKKCTAVIKQGKQCSRNASKGSDYCFQHKSENIVKDTCKVYTGSKGGKYVIKNGRKQYIKN